MIGLCILKVWRQKSQLKLNLINRTGIWLAFSRKSEKKISAFIEVIIIRAGHMMGESKALLPVGLRSSE